MNEPQNKQETKYDCLFVEPVPGNLADISSYDAPLQDTRSLNPAMRLAMDPASSDATRTVEAHGAARSTIMEAVRLSLPCTLRQSYSYKKLCILERKLCRFTGNLIPYTKSFCIKRLNICVRTSSFVEENMCSKKKVCCRKTVFVF